MVRGTDELGRIVIPIEMRKELGIENGSTVNIELKEDEIIITNPKRIDYKAKNEAAIDFINKSELLDKSTYIDTTYYKYFKEIAKILKEE